MSAFTFQIDRGELLAVTCALAWTISGHIAITPVARAEQPGAPAAPAPSVQQLKPTQKSQDARPVKPASGAHRKAQRINLLARIDPARDTVQGRWQMEGGVLMSLGQGILDRLELPLVVPKSYTLTLQIERGEGTEYIVVGVPVGDKLPAISLDSRGATSGLSLIDGKSFRSNESTLEGGELLPPGQMREIVCEVAPGKVKVTCDGRTIIDWSGDTSRLSADPDSPTPHRDRIYLASYQVSLRISKITLEVSRNPAPADPSKTAEGSGTSRRKPRATRAPPLENRLAVPTADEQRASRKVILDLYKDDLAQARKGGAAAFSNKLLSLAQDTTDDSAARYVLIDLARELSAAEGDMRSTLRAADELSAAFNVDPLRNRLQAAKAVGVAKIVPAAGVVAVESMLDLADDCQAANEFDMAAQTIKVAKAIARAVKDPELGKVAETRSKEIAILVKQFEAVKPQLAALKTDPANPAANLTVGRWYCLANDEWEKGLSLLAAGSDAELKDVATRDLGRPEAAAQQTSLGDAWWDLAQKERDDASKSALLGRAGYWYTQAEPGLQGLVQLKVQQRLKSIRK